MNSPKFWTMSAIGERIAGWPASKITGAKNRFMARASRLEKGGVTERVRGTRSLVQALAEFEGVQMRHEEETVESRAA
jgi:predicted transcriptional regulator of viral defense system